MMVRLAREQGNSSASTIPSNTMHRRLFRPVARADPDEQPVMIAAAGARRGVRRRGMRWLVLVEVLLVGGCTTELGPSRAELQAQWDAQNVVPQNYKVDLMDIPRRSQRPDRSSRRVSVATGAQDGRAGPALRRLRALHRARRQNTAPRRKAPRSTCRASSTASSRAA